MFEKNLVLLRRFGSIINDVVRSTNGQLELCDLWKLEKMRIRLHKVEHDLIFLKNCQYYYIYYTKILDI